MSSRKITVLVSEPGKFPKTRRIVPDMEAMREIVGRNPKETDPFSEPVAIVYDASGDELRLPGRYLLRNGSGEPYAVIRGTFLAVGVYDGNYISLTDAQIIWLLTVFRRDRPPGVERRNPGNFDI